MRLILSYIHVHVHVHVCTCTYVIYKHVLHIPGVHQLFIMHSCMYIYMYMTDMYVFPTIACTLDSCTSTCNLYQLLGLKNITHNIIYTFSLCLSVSLLLLLQVAIMFGHELQTFLHSTIDVSVPLLLADGSPSALKCIEFIAKNLKKVRTD